MGLQELIAHALGELDVFKEFLMFLDSPADRESDSAMRELLSGNTLVDQSSLLKWMLFALVIYTIISDFSNASPFTFPCGVTPPPHFIVYFGFGARLGFIKWGGTSWSARKFL